MPASKQVDLTAITATVNRAKGVMASAKVLIQSQTDVQKEAVRAALEADNAADDNTITSVMAAMDSTNADLTAGVDDLAAALVSNP